VEREDGIRRLDLSEEGACGVVVGPGNCAECSFREGRKAVDSDVARVLRRDDLESIGSGPRY